MLPCDNPRTESRNGAREVKQHAKASVQQRRDSVQVIPIVTLSVVPK